MKLTLAEPKYFKESVNIISELVNEARFKLTPNGMELVVMDPASVVMVIYNLLASSFTEYDIKGKEGEKHPEFAINLATLKQVLRRIRPNDMLSLEIDKDQSKLDVVLKGSTTRSFKLPLLDLDEKEQRVPDLKFPIAIKTTPAMLNDAVEDADIVSESVTILAEPGKFVVKAEGDLSQALIEVPAGKDCEIDMKDQSPTKTKYSIEYLKKMVGAGKVADNLTIRFNKDYPLKLEYTTLDKVSISFILAPRVDND